MLHDACGHANWNTNVPFRLQPRLVRTGRESAPRSRAADLSRELNLRVAVAHLVHVRAQLLGELRIVDL